MFIAMTYLFIKSFNTDCKIEKRTNEKAQNVTEKKNENQKEQMKKLHQHLEKKRKLSLIRKTKTGKLNDTLLFYIIRRDGGVHIIFMYN